MLGDAEIQGTFAQLPGAAPILLNKHFGSGPTRRISRHTALKGTAPEGQLPSSPVRPSSFGSADSTTVPSGLVTDSGSDLFQQFEAALQQH